MLDTAGKLLEQMLRPRILTAIQEAGDFSDKQHGFRPKRSTIGAYGKSWKQLKRPEPYATERAQ